MKNNKKEVSLVVTVKTRKEGSQLSDITGYSFTGNNYSLDSAMKIIALMDKAFKKHTAELELKAYTFEDNYATIKRDYAKMLIYKGSVYQAKFKEFAEIEDYRVSGKVAKGQLTAMLAEVLTGVTNE